jgi:superfamily II DNA/RNA helicase
LLSVFGLWISPNRLNRRSTNIVSFAELGISKPVVNALAKRDITEPFPIQKMVIRDALAGDDLLVQSPTGSGKTLAFGIPLVDLLEPGKGIEALVLAPTRELASQIVVELEGTARARGLRLAAVYGGVGFGPQSAAARKADIVVATPGRLEDLIQRGTISLKKVRILVLDEADRMLDMGFKPAVDRIVSQTPRSRQTLFFSATLEGATGKLAAAYTRDARRHTHEPPERKNADIEHRFVHVESQSAKLDHLVEELSGSESTRTLVFVRTKRGADRLVKRLRSRDVVSVAMHGDKSQRQREKALARFENGDVATLIATDVAARGIDVDDITHVVNFDMPGDRDTYVHRTGRTGRAGRTGTGVSFVLADQADEMRVIARDLGLAPQFDGAPGGPPRRGRSDSPGAAKNAQKKGTSSQARRRRRRRNGNGVPA